MTWLWLIGGFVLFMVFISAVNALDRHTEMRYGYRPLAVPNLALMLIPHGFAVAAVSGIVNPSRWDLPAPAIWLTGALGLSAVAFMLWIIARRTRVWIALAATLAMVVAASVLLFSMLFRALAEAPSGDSG